MRVLKNWCKLDMDSDNLNLYTDKHDDWNLVFAHHKEEDEIYPLTIIEIADAQRKDQEQKVYYKKKGSTKRALCGIVLFKLYTFFHVFCRYSIILSTDSTYSRVLGDQGGQVFLSYINL
jgi:hypothetical protein